MQDGQEEKNSFHAESIQRPPGKKVEEHRAGRTTCPSDTPPATNVPRGICLGDHHTKVEQPREANCADEAEDCQRRLWTGQKGASARRKPPTTSVQPLKRITAA